MPDDTINIRVYVSTNKVGSRCENVIPFDREEWEAMTPDERDELMLETMFDMIEWSYTEEAE